MEKKCQPWPAIAASQDGVRFDWAQARLTPPMYTPTARNFDDSHLVMAFALGAAQASNPGPVYALCRTATGGCGRLGRVAPEPPGRPWCRAAAGRRLPVTLIEDRMASASDRPDR